MRSLTSSAQQSFSVAILLFIAGALAGWLPIGQGLVATGIALTALFMARRGYTILEIVGPMPTASHWYSVLKLLPFLLLASFGLGLISLGITFSIFPDRVQEQLNVMTRAFQNYRFVITAVVLAPILEETLFRGLIFPLLSFRLGVRAGILLSSILFGLFHLNLLGATLFGLVAATFYARSGSLLLPIGLHFVNNAVSAIGVAIAPESTQDITSETIREALGGALLLAGVGGFFLFRFLRRNWPRQLPRQFLAFPTGRRPSGRSRAA